jgi:hypothetical protein
LNFVSKAFFTLALLCAINPALNAQSNEFAERLPRSILDVRPPSERVQGSPGNINIVDRSCSAFPLTQVRRRIVDTAVQEWAYFGHSTDLQPREIAPREPGPRRPFVYPRMTPAEGERLATSIAGYWAATPNSDWIVQRQNASWDEAGMGARWRDAWSAAFISWVICESGLARTDQFRRAIAHHSYIDQAILATDTQDPVAAYRAYPLGTETIVPGDLLCRGSRPAYRNIAERRAQLGVGARTHCDIVVSVDESKEEITVIGGNVRATVRMKIMPATRDGERPLHPIADNGRALFAHLQLQAPAIEPNALESSPSLTCTPYAATSTSPPPVLVAKSIGQC